MPQPDWNDRYATGDAPWDTGKPDPLLTAMFDGWSGPPLRVIEIGCGTGTNALWLAGLGFDVLGCDLSSLAIERATARLVSGELGPAAPCRFVQLDFLHDPLPAAGFDLAFDRGVLHVFDEANERSLFAERVASLLVEGGRWLSLSGSTEGPPRDHGPPRRSARDLVGAIEPWLEIVELRAVAFEADLPSVAAAWWCISRRRAVPAQPPTRRDE